MSLDLDLFAQTLSKAHCAHAHREQPDHACVGTCTIRRDGVELDCKSCGGDVQPLAPRSLDPNAAIAKAVCLALGISWNRFTPEAQRDAAAAVERLRGVR